MIFWRKVNGIVPSDSRSPIQENKSLGVIHGIYINLVTRVEFDDVSLISITKVLLFIRHCSHYPLNCCAVLVCTRPI